MELKPCSTIARGARIWLNPEVPFRIFSIKSVDQKYSFISLLLAFPSRFSQDWLWKLILLSWFSSSGLKLNVGKPTVGVFHLNHAVSSKVAVLKGIPFFRLQSWWWVEIYELSMKTRCYLMVDLIGWLIQPSNFKLNVVDDWYDLAILRGKCG